MIKTWQKIVAYAVCMLLTAFVFALVIIANNHTWGFVLFCFAIPTMWYTRSLWLPKWLRNYMGIY